MNKKIDRRNFLRNGLFSGGALFALSPAEVFFTGLVQGLFDKAYADETNASDMVNYLVLGMAGGPSRWYFDLPLMPNGSSDELGENPMLVTAYNDKRSQLIYRTMSYGDYHYPHLWSGQVSDGKGGLRPLSSLLNHSIMFRGINLQSDGHGINRNKQVMPIPGSSSLNGLVADKSKKAIPSVVFDNGMNYKSGKGIGAARISYSNSLNELLSPFLMPTGNSFGRRDTVNELIEKALNSLSSQAEYSSTKTKAIFNDRKNAKRLFEKEFGNLADTFSGLRKKYEEIISETLYINELTYLFDNSFSSDGGDLSSVMRSSTDAPSPDRRFDFRESIIRNNKRSGRGGPASLANTSISNLSSLMAVYEYLITQELSSSITGVIGGIIHANIKVNSIYRSINPNNDAHRSGQKAALFYFSKYYQAIGACILELTEVLKSKTSGNGSLFDKTVIHLCSEFNRSPRNNGSGADHGWRGSSTSLFTGMTNKGHVIGNIQANYTGDSNRRGGWGVAAHSDDLSGREMIIGNIASSLSAVLGIKSPTENDAPLIGVKNGKIINYASRPKNV